MAPSVTIEDMLSRLRKVAPASEGGSPKGEPNIGTEEPTLVGQAGTDLPSSDTGTGTPAVEGSAGTDVQEVLSHAVHEIADKTHIPVWGIIGILIGIALLFLCICFCCIKRWCRRRKKDGKKGLKGAVDLKGVQFIGNAYKEKVQPDMEELEGNMEGGDGDQESAKSEIKLGRLHFKLDYEFNSNNLAVTVIQAEELPGMDMSGTSDPYVKVYLLPDKKKKYETKVHRKTLNPVFNETFNFKVPYAEITSKTLVFAIFDFDRFSKHDQIGEVKLGLNTVDLAQTLEEWRDLTSVEGEQGQNNMTEKKSPLYQEVAGFRIPGIFSAEAYKTALKYKPRPDDLFIACFPRCGSTWVQQIVALILNNGMPIVEYVELSSRSPCLELTGAEGAEKMTRPGSIKVLLPFNLTPYSPEAKYIYLVRNPKDVLVSFFHLTRSYLYKYEDGEFNDYFELFINGQNAFGDYFDNVLSWYEHRNDPNVMFFCYEELKQDTSKTVKKIANFMGKDYGDLLENEVVLSDILKYSSFDYMKVMNDSLDSMSVSTNSSKISEQSIPAGLKHFMKKMAEFKSTESKPFELIRKGLVGGWKDVFTSDQNSRMDKKLQEKLGDTYFFKYWKSINCI